MLVLLQKTTQYYANYVTNLVDSNVLNVIQQDIVVKNARKVIGKNIKHVVD